MSDFLDLTVIIRTVGERTTAVCRKLIFEQGVPDSQIFEVSHAPFSKTLKESFKLGLKENRKFTLCIDADVLLSTVAIKTLLNKMREADSNIFEIQAKVLDKFLGQERPAGNHLYRTSLLEKMIEFIPIDGTALRPETLVMNRMFEIGYKWINRPEVIGIHDFEQFHCDIFRKSFLHAHKHKSMISNLVSYWKLFSLSDNDFESALHGLCAGILHNDEVYINAEDSIYRKMFLATNIIEKDKINPSLWELSDVSRIIEASDHRKNEGKYVDSRILELERELLSLNEVLYNEATVKSFLKLIRAKVKILIK